MRTQVEFNWCNGASPCSPLLGNLGWCFSRCSPPVLRRPGSRSRRTPGTSYGCSRQSKGWPEATSAGWLVIKEPAKWDEAPRGDLSLLRQKLFFFRPFFRSHVTPQANLFQCIAAQTSLCVFINIRRVINLLPTVPWHINAAVNKCSSRGTAHCGLVIISFLLAIYHARCLKKKLKLANKDTPG